MSEDAEGAEPQNVKPAEIDGSVRAYVDAKVLELQNALKERESSRLRATMQLLSELHGQLSGGAPVSLAAIKGVVYAWLYPRIILIVGSTAALIGVFFQTYLIWKQTHLMESQSRLIEVQSDILLAPEVKFDIRFNGSKLGIENRTGTSLTVPNFFCTLLSEKTRVPLLVRSPDFIPEDERNLLPLESILVPAHISGPASNLVGKEKFKDGYCNVSYYSPGGEFRVRSMKYNPDTQSSGQHQIWDQYEKSLENPLGEKPDAK